MTKESTYGLQLIDSNCNDCKFMVRNIARYQTKFAEDFDNQVTFFRIKKARRIWAAREKIKKDKERGRYALADALKLKFIYFPQTTAINYGFCQKFERPVEFIPNTLQLETQDCFEHRKSNF